MATLVSYRIEKTRREGDRTILRIRRIDTEGNPYAGRAWVCEIAIRAAAFDPPLREGDRVKLVTGVNFGPPWERFQTMYREVSPAEKATRPDAAEAARLTAHADFAYHAPQPSRWARIVGRVRKRGGT